MAPRSSRDDDLEDRLDELEETLGELRGELRADSRRSRPTPPSLGELLRFTEQYTIPTLIAMLEATIKSLDLLRRTLRLADPGRAAREETADARRELDRVGSKASGQLARSLSELRTALSEADLPENGDSRRLIEDARELTEEIEGRLREAERDVRREWDRERRIDRESTPEDAEPGRRNDRTARRSRSRPRDRADRPADRDRPNRGVTIDVRDQRDSDDRSIDNGGEIESAEETDESSSHPEIDVDSELTSIKEELGKDDPDPNDSKRADRKAVTGSDADDASDDGHAGTQEHGSNDDDDR
ncbi:MAG: DUF7547 family protein [Halobacteriota archaeon]